MERRGSMALAATLLFAAALPSEAQVIGHATRVCQNTGNEATVAEGGNKCQDLTEEQRCSMANVRLTQSQCPAMASVQLGRSLH